MPKAIFAITNIKVGNGPGEVFSAGSVVDKDKFTKAQLLELLDAGAIEVRVVEAPESEPVETPEPLVVITPESTTNTVGSSSTVLVMDSTSGTDNGDSSGNGESGD